MQTKLRLMKLKPGFQTFYVIQPGNGSAYSTAPVCIKGKGGLCTMVSLGGVLISLT